MIFKKLTLKNFKSHIDTEVTFNKGTTIVIGDNGAGKSSIFEGINFALYKKYNTKSLNDLINTKADAMTVSLSFLVGSTEYKVIRTRSQKKSTAELAVLVDGNYKTIVSGDKEVNNYIEELLQIDADLFLNAIYIKQGEIDSLVTQKASERKKNISKLLRLESLEISYKNMANVISNYELRRNQLNSLIDDDFQDNKEALKKEQQSLKARLDAKNNELSLLQSQIKDVKEKISEQNVVNVTYQQLNNKKTRLETEANSLSNNIDDLKNQINDFKVFEEIIDSLKDTTQNIDKIQELMAYVNEAEQCNNDISKIRQDIADNEKNLSSIKDIADIYGVKDILLADMYIGQRISQLLALVSQDRDETQKALQKNLEKAESLIAKTTALETLIADNKETLQTVQSVEGVCPICNSILDDEHKETLVKNYESLIAENESKLEKRNNELEVLRKEHNSLDAMLKEKTEFVSKVSNARLFGELIEKKITEENTLTVKLSQIKKSIKQYDEVLQLDTKIMDIKQIYDDVLDKQKQYQEAEFALKNKANVQSKYDAVKIQYHDKITELEETDNKIEDLGFDINVLQQYQQKQLSLQNEYYPLVKEIGEIENNIKYNQTQIDGIDDKIKQNKENKKKVKTLDEFITFLKDIRELYSKDGLQKDIRLSFKPQIEKYTQSFFEKFEFDYSGLKLSEDYDIVITGPSGDSDVTMASGGEKIAIALALRLGIAQAVTANTIETILLDEPTTYLDAIRKQEFINIVQNISLTPQMIIITHDAELENAANNIIMVEKKNGESVIV